jgi:hypothetical protein
MSDFPDPFDDGSDQTDHAPICPNCGVTALPVDAFGTGFACDNDDCDAYGELIGDS